MPQPIKHVVHSEFCRAALDLREAEFERRGFRRGELAVEQWATQVGSASIARATRPGCGTTRSSGRNRAPRPALARSAFEGAAMALARRHADARGAARAGARFAFGDGPHRTCISRWSAPVGRTVDGPPRRGSKPGAAVAQAGRRRSRLLRDIVHSCADGPRGAAFAPRPRRAARSTTKESGAHCGSSNAPIRRIAATIGVRAGAARGSSGRRGPGRDGRRREAGRARRRGGAASGVRIHLAQGSAYTVESAPAGGDADDGVRDGGAQLAECAVHRGGGGNRSGGRRGRDATEHDADARWRAATRDILGDRREAA